MTHDPLPDEHRYRAPLTLDGPYGRPLWWPLRMLARMVRAIGRWFFGVQ